MNTHAGPFGRLWGATTVGERGQVVIPAEVRKEMDLTPGTKLLVFSAMGGSGIVLVRAEVLTEFLERATSKLGELERLLKHQEPSEDS